jgi:hypothetical protein
MRGWSISGLGWWGALLGPDSEPGGNREGERVEPLGWLTDVLKRMVSGFTKAHELGGLLPWSWKAARVAAAVDAGMSS